MRLRITGIAPSFKRIQDSNGGMPIRRERKNSKTKSLSPNFQPMSLVSLNSSTNSLGSFSSEEDDDSEDDSMDESDVLSSSSSSSPEQPGSPEDSPLLQSLPQTPQGFVPLHQQQLLQELQMQQLQQAMLANPFDTPAMWDWAGVPPQQINVHTAGASLPVAMNGSIPTVVSSELLELYQQNFAAAVQPLQEMQYCFDASQVQHLNNASLEEYSPVTVEGSYGMNFLNMEMPGYCPLPLDI